MAITLTDTGRAALLSGGFIAAANSGKLKIYSGSVPANASASLGAAVLLATLTMNATSFGAPASGVITANAITSDTDAAATGTATFFRLCKSDNTELAQGTVGQGSGDYSLDNTGIAQHGTVTGGGTFTMPAS